MKRNNFIENDYNVNLFQLIDLKQQFVTLGIEQI